MKTVVISVVLTILFSCNTIFAIENIKEKNKKNVAAISYNIKSFTHSLFNKRYKSTKLDTSLKIRALPYSSFLKKLKNPNPVT